MKKRLILLVFFSLLFIFVQFSHSPSDENEVGYRRYREEFAHNLRNPLTEHYRTLSFEMSKERRYEENEMEETP